MRMGNNHRKKNRHLISGSVSDGGGGGNGIAGLVMFGGALVVTGFIAVATSAINKSRTKDVVNEPNPKPKPKPKPQQQQSLDNDCKSQEDHEIETTQGLRALLEPATNPTNDGEAASASHGATDMKSINNTCIPVIHSSSFATEEKIDHVPDLNTISEVVQEIVLSNDSNAESSIEEECVAPLFNSQGSQSQAQAVELEPQEKESLKSIEPETQDDGVVSESGEEEVVQEIVFSDDSHSKSAASSHDSVIQEECLASLFNSQGSQAQNVELELELEPRESLKPKETEKQDDDVVSEIAEEKGSSKAILNSNEKPIFCSTQEDFNFKGEGGKIDCQHKEHEAAKAIYYSAASRSFQMTMWLMPGLLLLLLLLLLIYGTQQFFVL